MKETVYVGWSGKASDEGMLEQRLAGREGGTHRPSRRKSTLGRGAGSRCRGPEALWAGGSVMDKD